VFKRILVPLDGSDLAERALPAAARIARATGGSIVLFGVATTPVDYGPYIVRSRAYAEAVVQNDLRRVREYLLETANSPTLVGIKVETHEVYEAATPAIIAATQTYQADMIVMCSHGYTGAKRWVIGSLAQKVARHGPVPVLVLRADGSTFTEDQPLRVLVAVDGSSLAEAALEPALQLIAALSGSAQSELHLLRVIAIPSPSGKFRSMANIALEGDASEEEKREAQAYLEALVGRLRQSGQTNVQIASSIIVDADIAAAIIQEAEQSDILDDKPYDFIAMATHGRRGVQRWALGSVTECVLGATWVPLLIIRPHKGSFAQSPIQQGSSYTVQPGDTLSSIAQQA
jgi:nucleotide-binding universal stress UspA family protein